MNRHRPVHNILSLHLLHGKRNHEVKEIKSQAPERKILLCYITKVL